MGGSQLAGANGRGGFLTSTSRAGESFQPVAFCRAMLAWEVRVVRETDTRSPNVVVRHFEDGSFRSDIVPSRDALLRHGARNLR